MQGGHPSPDPSRILPGRMVGPFLIESELGTGGMGVVYRATGPGGVAAAVKVLRVGLATPEVRLRFEREASIRIDHPNLIRVLDAGVDAVSGAPYLALELLEGESLEERLARGPLAAAQVIDLGLQACRGLEAAHAASVVHRDLKPSNLYLCADGRVKVLDFGIALVQSRETRLTSAGGIIGTPAYMSPEQVRGDSALDARTDVWSLGALLYEALTGRPPFMRETALAIMLAIHMEEPDPIWSLTPRAPAALGAAIERALAKRPELRWQTAAELAAALTSVNVVDDAGREPTDRPPPAELSLGDTVSADSIAPLLMPTLIPAGEHRIVAVLLAEGVRDLGLLGAAVREHGGTLLPLIGHRAMGLFGAETWEGDEVARAASAALGARRAAVRMAVASGRATSSGGGISGAVLRAAEAGCAATLRGVAVDPATARSLEAQFHVTAADASLWEITARRTVESVPFAALGSQPPLLGRDAELAQSRAALRSVLEEQRHAVLLVSGPPGIGKTRLRFAMEAELEGADEPIFTLTARAEPLRREAALALVGAALKGRLYARSSSPNATILDLDLSLGERHRAVADLVAEAIDDPATAASSAEFLGELMGVPMPDSPALLAAHADPGLMADRLRLALLDFFEGLASKGPVALLLEDLQWADQASLAFVDDLLDRLSEAPLLVFATARSELVEQKPALFSGRNVVRIEPRGLISSDVAALAKWIAGRPLPEALTRALAERTAGHPLFVEQIVLELKDHGRLDGDVGELPMTLTVEAAVQSRLDHLPPADKDACKRAAIFGRPFSTEELEAMGVSGAAAVLGSLGKRDLVAGRAKAGGGRGRQFQFRSTLVADVAYGMLADEVRKDLHRRAAMYLGRQPQVDDEEVGSHHERGGELDAAATRYASAALLAAPRGDTPTVLRCSERALALGAPTELRCALYLARADALRFLGRRDDQVRELELARAFASSDVELARVLTERVALMSRTGRKDEALAEAEAAVLAAHRAGDPEVITAARARHVGALIYGGELQRAREAFREAAALGDAAMPRTRAFLSDVRAQLAAALGDLGERRIAFGEAVVLYKQAGDIRRAAGAEANLADVYNRVGSYAEAEFALRAAIEGGRRVNNRRMEGYGLVNLGYALAMQGKTAEALEALSAALLTADVIHEVRLAMWAKIYIARARLRGGMPAEAAREAERVAAEAERVGEAGTGVVALTVASAARLAMGDPAGALALSERAIAGLDRLGGIEEDEAEVFTTHARALDAVARGAEALVVRRRGRARIVQIAEKISDSEWRERFLGAVVAHRELMAEGG